MTTDNPKLTLWPTHWSGGSVSWEPNRIRIEAVQGGGLLAWIEHHGPGRGNDKQPTLEDYKFARDLIHRYNAYDNLIRQLEENALIPNLPK